ncbi:helix-turn-helix domain-containing protein [Streptomyces anulatus]|uniref:helix-turn-helix domain-containing protein n=1 Tax=Streptomyces anulatus TaxID=1892 RepID=UPI003655587F
MQPSRRFPRLWPRPARLFGAARSGRHEPSRSGWPRTRPGTAIDLEPASRSHVPVGPQPHPDESRTDIGRSRRHQSVEPVLIDTAEVATMLSMSTSWVYREASKLGLKGYKLGRGRNAKVLYKRAEVFKWLEQQKIY